MGEMGDYTFLQHGGAGIGAMMTNPPGGGPPGWGFYFRVPDIESAKDQNRQAAAARSRTGRWRFPAARWY